jgi:hypothetical protein
VDMRRDFEQYRIGGVWMLRGGNGGRNDMWFVKVRYIIQRSVVRCKGLTL